jgi:hypothetical protein
MKCDIFIRSYKNDSEWLRYCIKSIEKYASGFNDVIITYPEGDDCCRHSATKNIPIKEIHTDGYIDQQLTKLNATKYVSNDTTHILFVDSDCCFFDKFTPDTYSINDSPYLCITHYDYIDSPWKNITQDIMGIEIEYEFMRRQPLMYRKESLIDFQNWFLDTKYITLIDFMVNVKERKVSEYNLIGSYVYYINGYDKYKWVNTNSDIIPYNPMRQFRSWDGIDEKIRGEIHNYL